MVNEIGKIITTGLENTVNEIVNNSYFNREYGERDG